jgi:hypothetical protein
MKGEAKRRNLERDELTERESHFEWRFKEGKNDRNRPCNEKKSFTSRRR